MPKTTGNQLRDLLCKQVQEASDEVDRSGGQVSVEQVETLGRLARLVEIYQAAKPPPTHQRWPFIVALGITFLIVGILLFARISETEIELDLAVTEMSFVLPTQQVLTDTIELSALGVSGLRKIKIEIPSTHNHKAPTLKSFDGVRLSVNSDGKRQGNINLASSMLPAKTHVWVRFTELSHQYRVSLKGTTSELQDDVNGPVQIGVWKPRPAPEIFRLQADVNGSVQVGFSGGGIEQLDFLTPHAVLIQAGSDEIDLDLTFLDPSKSKFSSQLAANDLSFFRIDEFFKTNRSIVRRVSTILSGSIYFVELNDKEHKLRPGEMIHFEHSEGEFRALRLQDDRIESKFHGYVRGLSVGSDKSRRSLMPTWLEFLHARHRLSLFLGTSLTLFGLIASALRFWRKPV